MSKDEFLIFVIMCAICAILVIAVLIYILYRILRNLFVYPYFVYSVVCPENENVSRLPYFFLDSETEFERTDGTFEQYSSEIYHKGNNVEENIEEIVILHESKNGQDYFPLICGKFLLTSLGCYLRKKTGVRIDNDNLKWSLINSFDISTLDYIKTCIMGDLQDIET